MSIKQLRVVKETMASSTVSNDRVARCSKELEKHDRFPDNQAEIQAYEIFKLLDQLVVDHHRMEKGEIPALRFTL